MGQYNYCDGYSANNSSDDNSKRGPGIRIDANFMTPSMMNLTVVELDLISLFYGNFAMKVCAKWDQALQTLSSPFYAYAPLSYSHHRL